MSISYTIPTVNVSKMVRRLTTLSKRAKKLDFPSPVWTLNKYQKKVISVNGEGVSWLDLTDVEISGEAPIMSGGWCFIAAVEAVDDGVNLILSAPNVDIDAKEYQSISMQRCDHCHVKHNRKAVYVVRDENGNESVVGKSCLKDFTGHLSPESIVTWAAMWSEIESMGSFEESNDKQSGLIDTLRYVSHVAACVRIDGWVSKSKAEETNTNSTASDAIETGFTSHITQAMKYFCAARKPIVEDIERARKAIEFAQTMDTSTGDFLYNIQVLSNLECFNIKHAGLVACIILLYNKELKRSEVIESSTSEYLGKVKDKIILQATFEGMSPFKGNYGVVYVCRFVSNGNRIVWWASNSPELTTGITVELKGTVKKLVMFKGVKQTVLTRCKVKEI